MQKKPITIENNSGGLLRNFGLKVDIVGTVGFGARIASFVDDMPTFARS